MLIVDCTLSSCSHSAQFSPFFASSAMIPLMEVYQSVHLFHSSVVIDVSSRCISTPNHGVLFFQETEICHLAPEGERRERAWSDFCERRCGEFGDQRYCNRPIRSSP